MPLTYLALYSSLIALWRRDWRVIPLIAWLVSSILLVWQQTPLFTHHLVTLIPPLVGLSIMGLKPAAFDKSQRLHAYLKIEKLLQAIQNTENWSVVLAFVLIASVAANNIQTISHYYTNIQAQGNSVTTQSNLRVVRDLEAAIQPGQQVITDAQFIAAQANRSTPAELVDTSQVRISAGYLTTPVLIQAAEQPQVHAILFYTGRLIHVTEFHSWVSQHYQLAHSYGNDGELWVKME